MAALASIGGLLLIAGLAFAVRFEQFRPIVYLVFLFMLGVAPPLSALLIYFGERLAPARRAYFEAGLSAIKAFLVCLLIALIASLVAKTIPPPPTTLSRVAMIVVLVFTALLVAWGGLAWLKRSRPRLQLDACLVAALAVAIFLLSPFNSAAPVPIGLVDYALNAPRFGWWLLLGITWTLAGIWLRRHEGWAFPRWRARLTLLALLAVTVVILGLYDDGHFVDMGHYMPLVGPALHAMRGGIPMVDVYSVYGLLPWLIHSAAFALFEPTFGTSAVLLRVINLAYFFVILSILFFVSRRRLSALWFFVPALLIAITSHNPGVTGMWNMNALPMTLGGRNLIPASMTLLLVAVPARNWARLTALGLLMLASLASIEIFAFTLAPWGYCLLLEAVRARSISILMRGTAAAIAAVVVAQCAFIGFIYLSTGAVVDYLPYFSLFAQFRPAEESIWSVPFVPDYALWLPIAASYFLIMAMAGYRALRRLPPESIIDRLLPVAVFGLGPLAYFFGRPQEGTLNITCLSFAVVAICISESLFIKARRFGAAGTILSAVIAASFAFAVADGFEHFMRVSDPSRGNSTVLRRCFTSEGCRLDEVPRNIALALHAQPLDPRTKVGYLAGDGGPPIEEAISMLRRLAPNDRYVGMLTEYQPTRYADAKAAIGHGDRAMVRLVHLEPPSRRRFCSNHGPDPETGCRDTFGPAGYHLQSARLLGSPQPGYSGQPAGEVPPVLGRGRQVPVCLQDRKLHRISFFRGQMPSFHCVAYAGRIGCRAFWMARFIGD